MREALDAARSLAEPEGWKLVPVEPTQEMVNAGVEAWDAAGVQNCQASWAAMLAASPTVEER
jgi:hypothetical protein